MLCLASHSQCTGLNGTTIEPFSDRTFQLSLRYCGVGLTLQEANLTTNDPYLPLARDWASFAKSFRRCPALGISTVCLHTHSLRMAASIVDPHPSNIIKRGTAFYAFEPPTPLSTQLAHMVAFERTANAFGYIPCDRGIGRYSSCTLVDGQYSRSEFCINTSWCTPSKHSGTAWHHECSRGDARRALGQDLFAFSAFCSVGWCETDSVGARPSAECHLLCHSSNIRIHMQPYSTV